jgi:hypothetical protein
MAVIDYKILSSFEGTLKLEELVKDAISNGWQPIGGVSTNQLQMPFEDTPTTYYLQAIVKSA